MKIKLKTIFSYVIGFPLLWGLIFLGGFIASSPMLTYGILTMLAIVGLIIRKIKK